jgi:heavy metal translocating P-type ATPase
MATSTWQHPESAHVSTKGPYKLIPAVLVLWPAAGLAAGFAVRLVGPDGAADVIWTLATIPVLLALAVEIATSLRRGDVGLDIVAFISMTAALAFGETLAAVVVALMYAGGQYLESFAERRAGREMTALLTRMPRTALRKRGGEIEEVALEAITPGDRLLVRTGDVLPVDGTVATGVAVLDQSALTGESLPVRHEGGQAVVSGVTNVGDAFELTASQPAAASTYASIIRLVEAAQRTKAPMARLADRYAIAFLAATLALAGGAWVWSGDPIRALSVLVIATPCPLILAVPVAIVSGMSRAARCNVLVKGGQALEALAGVRTLVLDKTGTITLGAARLVATHLRGNLGKDEILRIAASLDQASAHVIAGALVTEARQRGLALTSPSEVVEMPGLGVEGTVDGHKVAVGGPDFVRRRLRGDVGWTEPSLPAGALAVAVAIDRNLAGLLVFADPVRAETAVLLDGLKKHGIGRVILATGDRRDVADAIVHGLPFDAIRTDLSPDEKIDVVRGERARDRVMMVGDGVNDAPALAAADVGVAMGARGATAAAEAADVVLLADRLDPLLPAVMIAQETKRIALQSVWAGMGLSMVGMGAAALGYLTPVQGALIQEGIDVAVVLNALRALRD